MKFRPNRMQSVWLVSALLAALVPAATAHAHLGSRKYVRVEPGQGGAAVEVEVEAVDASMQLDLGEDVDLDALRARAPAIKQWLSQASRSRRVGGTARWRPGIPR